jgi:hypothetical protein
MCLQPAINNDDLQIDFYTVYKRETVEYGTEYMQEYDEDLDTTLIFVDPPPPIKAILCGLQGPVEPLGTKRKKMRGKCVIVDPESAQFFGAVGLRHGSVWKNR